MPPFTDLSSLPSTVPRSHSSSAVHSRRSLVFAAPMPSADNPSPSFSVWGQLPHSLTHSSMIEGNPVGIAPGTQTIESMSALCRAHVACLPPQVKWIFLVLDDGSLK